MQIASANSGSPDSVYVIAKPAVVMTGGSGRGKEAKMKEVEETANHLKLWPRAEEMLRNPMEASRREVKEAG
jgi:hypothetical protein